MSNFDESKGKWRTIRGRRVFIAEGQSLGEAMAKSGKFKNLTRSKIRETRDDLRQKSRSAETKKVFDKKEDIWHKEGNSERYKKYSKKFNKLAKREPQNIKEELEYQKQYDKMQQAEKNRINEKAPINEKGKTRVQRNKERYSETDKRELRHENIQKKLAEYKAKKQSNNKITEAESKVKELEKTLKGDIPGIARDKAEAELKSAKDRLERLNKQSNIRDYKQEQKDLLNDMSKLSEEQLKEYKNIFKEQGKNKFAEKIDKHLESRKQSNNKVDPYDDPESEESQRLLSIQSRYDEYLQDTEGRGASYGEIAYVDSLRGKDLDDFEKELDDYETKKYSKQETIKNYVEKKKSNNAQITNRILESGKVNQKTLKSYAKDGLATDISNYSDKELDKLEKKHGKIRAIKTTNGVYGMNGGLFRGEKSGEYFVITSRSGNLYRLV